MSSNSARKGNGGEKREKGLGAEELYTVQTGQTERMRYIERNRVKESGSQAGKEREREREGKRKGKKEEEQRQISDTTVITPARNKANMDSGRSGSHYIYSVLKKPVPASCKMPGTWNSAASQSGLLPIMQHSIFEEQR